MYVVAPTHLALALEQTCCVPTYLCMDLRYEGVLCLCFRVAQKLLDPSHGGACTSDDQAIACLLLKNCVTILKSSSQRQSLEVHTYIRIIRHNVDP